MSRGSRSRTRSRNRSRTRNYGRNLRGGSNYSSAATYAEYVAGSQEDQFGRVFNQSSFPGRESNLLIGAQGQWGNTVGTPSAQNLSLIQRAGNRKRKSRKGKRGGFLGPVINQAVVPFSLLAMQQLFIS